MSGEFVDVKLINGTARTVSELFSFVCRRQRSTVPPRSTAFLPRAVRELLPEAG